MTKHAYTSVSETEKEKHILGKSPSKIGLRTPLPIRSLFSIWYRLMPRLVLPILFVWFTDERIDRSISIWVTISNITGGTVVFIRRKCYFSHMQLLLVIPDQIVIYCKCIHWFVTMCGGGASAPVPSCPEDWKCPPLLGHWEPVQQLLLFLHDRLGSLTLYRQITILLGMWRVLFSPFLSRLEVCWVKRCMMCISTYQTSSMLNDLYSSNVSELRTSWLNSHLPQ